MEGWMKEGRREREGGRESGKGSEGETYVYTYSILNMVTVIWLHSLRVFICELYVFVQSN